MVESEVKYHSDVIFEEGFLLSRVNIGDKIEYTYRDDDQAVVQSMIYRGFGLYRGELVIIEDKIIEFFSGIEIPGFDKKEIGLALPNTNNTCFTYAIHEIEGRPAFLVAEVLKTNGLRSHRPKYFSELPELSIAEGDLGIDDL